MMDEEAFSNPIAPPEAANKLSSVQTPVTQKQNLSNDDFRKLMMTPRAGGPSPALSKVLGSVRSSRRPILTNADDFKIPSTPAKGDNSASAEKKKSKKFFVPKKSDTDDTLAELAKKYRDRAKERRENANPDYQAEEDPLASLAYQSVAPGGYSGEEAADRRRQLIEESKFLGGDMKHTHLVKGLDYALLQKVKAEIELGEEEELERETANALEKTNQASQDQDLAPIGPMAKNILNVALKLNKPKRNDLFSSGRMIFVFELEDFNSDAIPTAVIRSKADCPNWEAAATLSTSEIVINKLISIWAYLRSGGAKKKRKERPLEDDEYDRYEANKKAAKAEPVEPKKAAKVENDISIYDDLDDYVMPEKRPKNSQEVIENESSEDELSDSEAVEKNTLARRPEKSRSPIHENHKLNQSLSNDRSNDRIKRTERKLDFSVKNEKTEDHDRGYDRVHSRESDKNRELDDSRDRARKSDRSHERDRKRDNSYERNHSRQRDKERNRSRKSDYNPRSRSRERDRSRDKNRDKSTRDNRYYKDARSRR